MVHRKIVFSLLLAVAFTAGAQDKARRDETNSNTYYQKWLNEDVFWIISQEEREVFSNLKTDEERDAFIDQFWTRRDTDPTTTENEFKIEHYRRIQFANENYSAGIEGWKTDRGMIYIKFGPPDRRETQPAGGPYARERKEGGGITSVFPFEKWEYRHIDDVGDDVELEFVDDKGGGLYELTTDNQRKDALILSGRMGLTYDEQDAQAMGVNVNKRDRILGRRQSGDLAGIYTGANSFETAKDKPFAKLEASAGVSRPPTIRFKDLEAVVTTRVTYNGFPFDVRPDFIRITDQQVLVPVTVLISNEQMTFKQAGEGLYRGSVQIYGRVVGLGNRVEAIFEDEVAREFSAEDLNKAKTHSSVYQKRLILRPGLYKVEVAVKDVEAKRIGMVEQRLEVPKYAEGQLRLSSLILADKIEPGTQDRSTSSFILGDLKVVPKTDDVFHKSGNLGVYVQIYNFGLDQQTSRPGLKFEYGIAPKGAEPQVWRDASPFVQYAGNYCRIARMVNLSQLTPGPYVLLVRVRDTISGQSTTSSAGFTVTN